jgi:hypothetical protein
MRDPVYKAKLLNMKVRTSRISERNSNYARSLLMTMKILLFLKNIRNRMVSEGRYVSACESPANVSKIMFPEIPTGMMVLLNQKQKPSTNVTCFYTNKTSSPSLNDSK